MKIVHFLKLIMVGLVGTGCSLFGIRSEEQPNYEVLIQKDNKEIRQYQSYIVAKTTVEGRFEEAQSQGFKILAGYIFVKNKSQEKIAMTAPVTQNPEAKSEKISMTAPVTLSPERTQKLEDTGAWTMTFSMPSTYTLESLPVPEDKRIVIEKRPPRLVAAIVFSGFWGLSKNQKKAQELLDWLDQLKEYKVDSPAQFAGYNPPWTLPFFRRNEMLLEISTL